MLIECNHKWDYPSDPYMVLDCYPPIEPRVCRNCGATASYQEGRGTYDIDAKPIEVEDWPLEPLPEAPMEVIRLHPAAQSILVVTPEDKENFNRAAKVLIEAFAQIKKAFQEICKVMVKAFQTISKFTHHQTPIRLYPTANLIEVPFYKAVELGYFRE